MEGSPATLSSSEASSDIIPRYLKVLRPLGITLCVEHGGCYTSANVARHLARSHSLKARRVREVPAHISEITPWLKSAGYHIQLLYISPV
jgi:hypothetical protein